MTSPQMTRLDEHLATAAPEHGPRAARSAVCRRSLPDRVRGLWFGSASVAPTNRASAALGASDLGRSNPNV